MDYWERVGADDRLAGVRRKLSMHELRMLFQHARDSILEAPALENGVVYVEVSGLTGSGKSAVLGEIEISLQAIGLTVEHDADFQSEKNMTHADWQEALDLYKPRVKLTERNVARSATS